MLEVPFFSQQVEDPEWRGRACGAVCLTMAVHALGTDRPTVHSVIEKLVDGGGYVEPQGWVHEGIAAVAASYGLQARLARIWSRRGLAAALDSGRLCIASVGPGLRSLRRRGHLVLVVGTRTHRGRVTQFLVHDPAARVPQFVPTWRFMLHFSGRTIVLGA